MRAFDALDTQTDLPAKLRTAATLFLISPTRVIVDRDYAPSPLLPALNPASGQPLDLSLSQLRSVSPVHLEYLRNMGVQASLTASLLRDGRLWGLLACRSREDAYAIIGHGAAGLFAPWTGALAVVDEAGSDLRRVAAWGDPDGLSAAFAMHDCWALRRGQPHEVEPSRADIDCRP